MGLGSFSALAKELNGAGISAVVSADGRRIYIVGKKVQTTQDADGNLSIDETSLGLKVVDIESDDVLATVETPATGIALAPDVRHLILGGWSNVAWTDVMDIQDYEVKAELRMLDLSSLEPIDGEPWIAFCSGGPGATSRVTIVNADSWGVAQERTITGYVQLWRAWGGPAP